MSAHRNGLMRRSCRGRRTRQRHIGVFQEPGRSRRFHFFKSWRRGTARTESSWSFGRRRALGRNENRREEWHRQAKETKHGGKNDGKSERLVVPAKQGNPNHGDPVARKRGGKGTPCCGSAGRKHAECIGTRYRVNAMPADS